MDKYTARVHTSDEDAIVLRPNEPGLPSFRIKAKDFQSQEFVRKAWLKDINEMQDAYCMDKFCRLSFSENEKKEIFKILFFSFKLFGHKFHENFTE